MHQGEMRESPNRRGETDFPRRGCRACRDTAKAVSMKLPTSADGGMVVFCANGCLNENKNLNKRRIVMRTNTSAKMNSGRGGADKVSKASTKRNAKQMAKWKVVNGKVEVSPGDYSIDDLEAMLKAIR